MKKLAISICIGVFAAISVTAFSNSTGSSLANGVIRLHVRANSNSSADQNLKLAVRDRILEKTRSLATHTHNAEDARQIISQNLGVLKETAQSEIAEHGFDYPVEVKLGKSDFPQRVYGNMTFPAGTYTAVTVDIGTGKGENWWCVMFPPLCFTRETFAHTEDKSDEMLIENLGTDTYSMINGGKVQIKFKIYELLQHMK